MHQLQPLQSLEGVALALASGGAGSCCTLSREMQHRARGDLLTHLTGRRCPLPKMPRPKLWGMHAGWKGSVGHGLDTVKPPWGWRSSFSRVQRAVPGWVSRVCPQSSTGETLLGLSGG